MMEQSNKLITLVMDISLAVRTIRDIVDQVPLNSPSPMNATQKNDGTWVTNVDPLVENVVCDRLRQFLPHNTIWIGEETSTKSSLSIRHLCEASTIVTIDGIDGTDYFIQHCQKQEENDKWLAALTAIYQRNLDTGLFDPVFAFAFQPQTDRLFCYAENIATCIVQPLSNPTEYQLNVDHVNTDGMRGSIDVYLNKAECPHAIANSYIYQNGPSGFNMASLLAACHPDLELNSPVNFTSFHYQVWDFGLWPILNAAGFSTVDYQQIEQRFSALDLQWFGSPDQPLGKIARPVLIAPEKLMVGLAGVITDKLATSEKSDLQTQNSRLF